MFSLSVLIGRGFVLFVSFLLVTCFSFYSVFRVLLFPPIFARWFFFNYLFLGLFPLLLVSFPRLSFYSVFGVLLFHRFLSSVGFYYVSPFRLLGDFFGFFVCLITSQFYLVVC